MNDAISSRPPRLDVVASLVREWWIIVLAALLATGIGLTVADRQTPQWLASATSVVAPNPDLDSDSALISSTQGLDRRSTVGTYAEILASDLVLRRSAFSLGIGDPDAYEVDAQIVLDSNVLRLDVRGEDAEEAANLANAVVSIAGSHFESLYSAYSVTVLDPAVPPTTPVEPKPVRNAIAAGLLGALVAAAAVAAVTTLQGFRSRRAQDNESRDVFVRLKDTGSDRR